MPPPPTPVRVRVWFSVSVRIRAGGTFPREQLSSYNQFHNILSLFYQAFLSPQVERWLIITYKHGTHEFPYELPSDLGLRILGN